MTATTGPASTPEPTTEHRRAIPADTFAARLMLARLHAGNLTIQDAADRCGLLNQSWSNWERGMQPRGLVEVVQAISEGLGIDRNWLLFGGPLATEPRTRPGRRRTRTDQGRVVTNGYPLPAAPSRFGQPRPGGPSRPPGRAVTGAARPITARPAGHPVRHRTDAA